MGFAKVSALAAVGTALTLAVGQGRAQYQAGLRNLTPDGYWHNRYHALLSMAAYGDYETLCPNQTFTEEAKLRNFPESNRSAWEVYGTFGPTAHGAKGFMAIIPEMNKALIVFEGNYEHEQQLTTDVVSWGNITEGLGYSCPTCTANAYAVQGYLEAKEETNNFEAIRMPYYNSGLVFSIAGHGLGGMHSFIASADFNDQNICYYSHSYGAPRVFNQAGANWYNARFNGEAGERAVANNDQYTEFIAESEDYAHSGTTFYYYGHNNTGGHMNWEICWPDVPDTGACSPRPGMSGYNSTAEEDHYFYFSNVGQCGGKDFMDTTVIDQFLNSPSANSTEPFIYSSAVPTSTTTSFSRTRRPRPTGTAMAQVFAGFAADLD